jgi:hypothetical protein
MSFSIEDVAASGVERRLAVFLHGFETKSVELDFVVPSRAVRASILHCHS